MKSMFAIDPYDALVPIFLKTEIPRRISQIGTAVFVELHGEPFLYTVAHVTDELKQGNLLVPTVHGLQPIEGYVGYIDLPPEVRRIEDDVDIGYYRLSFEFARNLCHHFRPLEQKRCELVTDAGELAICSAVGYPSSRARRTKDGQYSSEIFAFRGVVAKQEIYETLALSRDMNIVIHFSRKRAINPQTFAAASTPGLKGVSGGGIFAWPPGSELSEDWSLPTLVGLIHTFKEKEGLIIGTTLLPVLTAIQVGRMKNYGGMG